MKEEGTDEWVWVKDRSLPRGAQPARWGVEELSEVPSEGTLLTGAHYVKISKGSFPWKWQISPSPSVNSVCRKYLPP